MSTPADDAPRASVLRAGPSADSSTGGAVAPFDPLRLCIFTTIALLAWVLSPPVVVVWMATLGLVGYVKAYRAGLARSRCYLRDVRLVLTYLSIAWLVGAYFTVKEIISLLG
jgi:hypothetical protein